MAENPVDTVIETLVRNLAHCAEQAPSLKRLIVAYSGGRDSHVLLDALLLARDRGRLSSRYQLLAVHINHGLSQQAEQWALHCQRVCQRWQLDLKVIAVNAHAPRGESPEARARHARYEAFSDLMNEGDAILTAHHQDDQAETLLLQLLRGAGPKGLAAMPQNSPLARGVLLRLLLPLPRSCLEDYARARELQWIEDDSNTDIRYDRNYLRQQLMPLLKQRWPSCSTTLSRSASLCAEADRFIDDTVFQDYLQAQVSPNILQLEALLRLEKTRRAYVLRHWIQQAGFALPSYRQLMEIERELLHAKPDANPVVAWQETECRRYQGQLHLMVRREKPDNNLLLDWNMSSRLSLPGGGSLRVETGVGKGLAVKYLRNARVQVGFRQGGEQIQLPGHKHHSKLKKLLQTLAIPPWQRHYLPLIYLNGQLAAVAHYYVATEFAAGEGENACGLVWEYNG